MKKILLKCIAMMAVFAFTVSSVFVAGRPMTKAEQNAFIEEMMSKMEAYIDSANRKDFPKTLTMIDQITDDFDREHGFPPDDPDPSHCTVSFEKLRDIYHEHVSNVAAFVKRPLNCRAVALYVVKELMDRGITCFFTTHQVLNNHQSPELHCVVAYNVEKECYICDFARAFTLYSARRLGGDTSILPFGKMQPKDLLATPFKSYQSSNALLFDVRRFKGLPAIEVARIDRVGWYPLKFNEYKDKTASEVLNTFNLFDEMTPDELERYYGVRTMEEAKKSLEGKTSEQIKAMVYDRLRSLKS